MKQFSFLIMLLVALNCTTLNSTQENRLPEIRFLKAEKRKYGSVTYYFQLFKNNADTSLYFSSTGNSNGKYDLGNYEIEGRTFKAMQIIASHAKPVKISSLPDSTILIIEDIASRKLWRLGFIVWNNSNPKSEVIIYSDEIKPIKFRKTKKK